MALVGKGEGIHDLRRDELEKKQGKHRRWWIYGPPAFWIWIGTFGVFAVADVLALVCGR